jgi:hypothetical protein
VASAILLLAPVTVTGQQRPADSYKPDVPRPAYRSGEGPVVLFDEAHHNFHTVDSTVAFDGSHDEVLIKGRYHPFAELLRKDGYVVESNKSLFTAQLLSRGDIVVIANALAGEDVYDWSLPNEAAFQTSEVDELERWVRRGGSLLLIADHQPWPAAAAALAERFGVLFNNGLIDELSFRRIDGSLRDHPIARGRTPDERIDSVQTFSGQAFRPRPGVKIDPLLVIGRNQQLILHWNPFEEITNSVPHIRADGMLQGAVARIDSGRVAVFGEAAMFTAQAEDDGTPFGINSPQAPQNEQFVLNVLHWLSGLITDR